MRASDLTALQRGDRRYLIESRYRYRKWYPKALFGHVMREAIFHLSQGTAAESCADSATAAFMSAAIDPGLDVSGINPYPLAQDFCAAIRTILEYLSRTTLMSLHAVPDTVVEYNGTLTPWTFMSPMDDTGALHRWVFVDHLSDDMLYHHSRAWETWADMCVAPSMCWLHMIAVGSTREGRRQSPWSKCYSSPSIANLFKFRRKSGELQGNWRTVYFADAKANQANKWVDLMMGEEVPATLVRTVGLPEPRKEERQAFLERDLMTLTERMLDLTDCDPFQLPMCRASCDTPFPCPHEQVCYSKAPSISALESTGLYARLPKRKHLNTIGTGG